MEKPGDSRVQRDAEPAMVEWLSKELNLELSPKRFVLGGGARVEVDAATTDGSVLCEAWAHQGVPKSAQKFKIMNDAMKLLTVRNFLGDDAQMILLFADEAAASQFSSGTWRSEALQAFDFKIVVAKLDEQMRQDIRNSQVKQYR